MAIPRELLKPGDGLLIVDVQKDFCPGGALPIAEGDRVVPILNRWLRAARERGIPVYASRDWHPRRHASFREQGGPWPPHCIQGSEGARFHPKLELPEDAVAIAKGVRLDHDQYSAFEDTRLAARLAREGVRRLWVGGLALEVCVRASVLDALGEGFAVHLIVDGTRPVNEEAGREALQQMKEAGAKLEGEA